MLYVIEQPLPSVTSAVYKPAASPLVVVCTASACVLHENVHSATPPAAATVATASLSPEQRTWNPLNGAAAAALADTIAGSVSVVLCVAMHPFESRTRAAYVPAVKLTVVVLSVPSPPAHEKVQDPTPPEGFKIAWPSESPWQWT